MRQSIAAKLTLALALSAYLVLRPAGAPGAGAPNAPARVLFDLAHHNFGVAGDLRALSPWLAAEGLPVTALRSPFERTTLSGVAVVVIKNALAERNALAPHASDAELARAWSLPTPSAFTAAEIALLRDWVAAGGGLLLVFDHMPMPGGAQALAAAFGVEPSNGNAVDSRALPPFDPGSVARAGRLVFARVNGTLADDPLTNGRGPSERVDAIAADGGAAFRLPPRARSLLTFPPGFVSLVPEIAWRFSEATPRTDVAGWSQAGVLEVGRGRLAVFGDGSLLLTPEAAASLGRRPDPRDVARASFDQTPRLLLNVLRWLARAEDAR